METPVGHDGETRLNDLSNVPWWAWGGVGYLGPSIYLIYPSFYLMWRICHTSPNSDFMGPYVVGELHAALLAVITTTTVEGLPKILK